MRLLARHLPAFLTLLVPLALLAWLGGSELSRLEVRADRLLDERAANVLAEADRHLRDHVAARADRLLANLPDLALLRLVHATQALREREPDVLDLCVVDTDGHLVFPRASPDALDGLPYHWASPAAPVRRAAVLEAFGDLAGARDELERFLAANGERDRMRIGREDVLVRARFSLARVLRGEGDLDAAADHLRRVVVDTAPRPGPARDVSRARHTDAAVAVLAELALAELDAERGRGVRRAVALMRDIAAGVRDDVADALLADVLQMLDALVPGESTIRPAADIALRTDGVRRDGRVFADEYRAFVRQAVARKIRLAESGDRVLHVHNGPAGGSLLVLRPLTGSERENALEFVGDAGWIGVRLDVAQLLRAGIGSERGADATGFRLSARDIDGVPFEREPSAAAGAPHATSTSIGGIQLEAIPVDPESLIAERRQSNRTRVLLLVALSATVGAGALLLVRSVAREAEFAAARLRFVSRVSHELRTPLSVIRLYAETLALGRAADRAEASRFAGIVTREVDHLTRLVDRVLDLTSAEQRSEGDRVEPTDLDVLLARIADGYRPHLTQHDTRLRVEITAGVRVRADASAIESAVVAMLENAVKYGPEDPAEREVLLSLSRRDSVARVEVADRGIGIPAKERDRVFDSFYRASNAGERRGAGLGLDLVLRVAKRHSGTAEALPRPGGGTIVRLTLPTADEQPA